MSFHPDILTPDVLDNVATRMTNILAISKHQACETLAGTLGYNSWSELQIAPASTTPTSWLASSANRKLLWKMWSMYMSWGVSLWDALAEMRRDFSQLGHGQDMVNAMDHLQQIFIKAHATNGEFAPDIARIVALYDQEEATRFYISSKCGTFHLSLAKMAE